jgi:hypothetical protein
MSQRIHAVFAISVLLFVARTSNADSITVATGETIVATFDLTDYQLCVNDGSCSDLPQEVEPAVYIDVTANGVDQYSLQLSIGSTNDGQVSTSVSLPLDLAVDSFGDPIFGLFRFDGGIGGGSVDLPADPTFWGTDPITDTFQLQFKNTGDPFTLLFDPNLGFLTPEDAISSGVGSPGIGVVESPDSVSFVPEPNGPAVALAILMVGIAALRRLRLR